MASNQPTASITKKNKKRKANKKIKIKDLYGKLEFLHGSTYQIGMSMILFHRGLNRRLKDFELESEVDAAKKFDDVVFNFGNNNYYLIQLKHKTSKNLKIIMGKELFGEELNGAFSLIKYVLAYNQLKTENKFINASVKAIVFTNLPLNIDDENNIPLEKGKLYKKGVFLNKETAINVTDITANLNTDIINFTSHQSSTKFYQFTIGPIVQILKRQINEIEKDKDAQASFKNQVIQLTEDDIKNALNQIIWAVEQPDADRLLEFVKNELKEDLKLVSSENIFNELHFSMTKWMTNKTGIFQPIIKYEEAEKFYESRIKIFSFEVINPTKSFVGREKELNEILQKLEMDQTSVVSQVSSIVGLGGIGKTELAKMFVQKFKNKFNGRIIWVNAESENSIKIVFERIVKELNLSPKPDVNSLQSLTASTQTGQSNLMSSEEETKSKINLVLTYFKNVIALFVFDNAVKSDQDQKINYISYFRKLVTNRKLKIYTIITTRDSNFDKNISAINLDVLDESSAILLVQNQLTFVSDKDAKDLVDKLQLFPLALQQAIAYIKNKNEKSLFDGKYSISNYIEEFETKAKDLLNFKFEDEYGETNFKTTFITWNVTTDEISKEQHGSDAIKILKIMAYLAADDISPSIFLEMFKNNETVIEESFYLLKRYNLLKENQGKFNIHRLVQSVIRLKYENESQEIIENALIITFICTEIEFKHTTVIWFYVLEYPELVTKYTNYKNMYDMQAIHYWAYLGGNKNPEKSIAFEALRKLFEILLNAGADVEAKTNAGNSPLHVASIIGHIECLKILLEAGVNKEAKTETGATPTHCASENGHIECLKILLEAGVNKEAKTETGATPIHCASENGHHECLKMLLEAGADKEAKINSGHSPLHLASQNGHHECLKMLLEADVNKETKTETGATPLHFASGQGHNDCLKILLEAGADKETKTETGATPLHCASENGHHECLKMLLEADADKEAKTNSGHSALHFASENGHHECLKMLLEAGADKEAKTETGATPLYCASQNGHHECLKILLEADADKEIKTNSGHSPLHHASQNGHHECLKMLLEAGVNKEAKTEIGATPLHSASQNGHHECLKMLLEAGVNKEAKINSGHSPLHLASQNGHLECLKMLLEAGADKETKTKEGFTPLHVASVKGHNECLKMLLEADADKEAKTNSGHSPLHFASDNGHHECLKMLLEADADKEAKTNSGHSPLHFASDNGHHECLKMLLEADADKEAKTNSGHSPLHFASENGHHECLKMLLEAGADKEAKINSGHSPLHLASQYGHHECLKMLLEADVNKETKTETGTTPLHLASGQGHNECLKILLEAGADKETKTETGATPLHCASENGHHECLKILLEADADKEAKINSGHSALHFASENGHHECLKILLEAGADKEARTKTGATPLNCASRTGHHECLKMLLEAGADKEAKINSGHSPLHYASQNGHHECLKMLLEAGVNKEAKTEIGATPLHSASHSGHHECLKMLLEAGADKEAKINSGHSPLHFASKNGHHECLKMLLEAGADKEATIDVGFTPLHFATLFGHYECIKTLLLKGADASATTNDKKTPLQLAADNNCIKLLSNYVCKRN